MRTVTRGIVFTAGSVFGIMLVATCGSAVRVPTELRDAGIAAWDGFVGVDSMFAHDGLVVDIAASLLHDGGPGDLALPTPNDGTLLDIATADAAPGPAIQAMCNQTFVHTETDKDNIVTVTTTTYYADVPVPGLDPTTAPTTSVVLCKSQCFGTSCNPNACHQGDNCHDV